MRGEAIPIKLRWSAYRITAVKESKVRVTSAICNSALRWSSGMKIINLGLALLPSVQNLFAFALFYWTSGER